MNDDNGKPDSIDAYIANFPEGVPAKLREMQAAIRETAPEALELVSKIVQFRVVENLEKARAKKK